VAALLQFAEGQQTFWAQRFATAARHMRKRALGRPEPASVDDRWGFNSGQSRMAGAELDASISPIHGLSLDFAYAISTPSWNRSVCRQRRRRCRDILLASGLLGQPVTLAPRTNSA